MTHPAAVPPSLERTWGVYVADRKSGKQRMLRINAETSDDAMKQANEAGWLVKSCEPIATRAAGQSGMPAHLVTPASMSTRYQLREDIAAGIFRGYLYICALHLAIGFVAFVIWKIATSH